MMMKKLLICLSLNLLSIMPIMAFYVDNINYAITSDTTVEVTSPQDSLPRNVVIPEQITYDGKIYRVTSIGKSAFHNCGFSSITIPNSVTSIGSSAFSSCSKLTSVVVESGNTIYDSRDNCNAIINTATNTLIAGCQGTIIPNSVVNIGWYAFDGCSSLTSIEIPNSVAVIGYGAFLGCSSLTSMVIPSSVTSIGDRAFGSCSSLTSVVWNAKNCTNSRIEPTTPFNHSITSFIFGNEVEHIPAYLCSGLSRITSITIPNSVTSIGDEAFYGCSSLSSIEIPNSVTSIGDEAFYGCSSLSSIEIPNSVTSIGSLAFSNCSKLTSVVVESGNTIYDSRDNCNAIVETTTNTLITGCQNTIIPNSVTSIGKRAFEGSSLTSIEIPNSVISIEDSAFHRCYLTSIEIPNSVMKIGDDAFLENNTFAISVDDGNKAYDSRNNCNAIIETATNTLIIGCHNTIIPNSVADIGKHAFYSCDSLETIDIPNSVTYISSRAFYYCSRLTSVMIGNSVRIIGADAFAACYRLTSITIPNSVTIIGGSAFSGCSSLTSITIPNSVKNIGYLAFYGCDGLSSVYCAAKVPPTLVGAFSNRIIDSLYVPLGCLQVYEQSSLVDDFMCIGEYIYADVLDITTTSATLMWGGLPDVKYYIVNVYEENTPYAEFIVDDKGVIISENYEDGTAKASTARDLARLNIPIKKMGTDTTTNNTEYFVIQLDGLQSGTQYSYTVRGMNAKDECIYEETVQFTTLTMSAITEIFMDDQEKHTPTKILHRGNLYILHPDGSLYDMKGTKVKRE